MKQQSNRLKKAAAILILVVAAALLIGIFTRPGSLVLKNGATGEVYARYPMREGEGFSVGFIHSVNKSPVTDEYEIRDGQITVVRTIDYGFGAGVQTQIEEGQTLTYGEDGLQHMTLNGEDVTEKIRLPEISLYTSAVSAYPAVRAHLLEMQRKLAREHNVVMDGRDIGTVVLPDAAVKIFLTASPEERARRRCRELEQRGTPEAYEKVLAEMRQRDYDDSHRAAAPLRQAEDAVLLDTTELDFDGSRQALLKIIRERTAQ